jgi:hypothetical protein
MLHDLDAWIVATLAYAGLFGAQPVHLADVREALDRLSAPGGPVVPDEGRYTLTAPTKVPPPVAPPEPDAPAAADVLPLVRRWAALAGAL